MAAYLIIITYFLLMVFLAYYSLKNFAAKKYSIAKSHNTGMDASSRKPASLQKANHFFAAIGRVGKKFLFKSYFEKLTGIISSNSEYKNSNMTVETFIGFKFSLSILLSLLCAVLIKESLLMIFIIISVMAAGFVLPDCLVVYINIKRQKKIDRELPDIIDLLYISSLAGQNIYNSIKIIAEKYNDRISSEFMIFLRQIDFGIGKKEAYTNMLQKNNSDSFKSFIFTLQQAENYGSSVSDLLRQKSEFLRFEIRQEIEKRTRLASTKILFPLIFLILPSFILLVCAPIVFMMGGEMFMSFR